MDVKNELLELGSPDKVGYMLSMLNLTQDDFHEPGRFEKIKDVLLFLNTHPDPSFFVRKALGSKQVDRTDFMHEYIGRHKDLLAAKDRVKKLEEEISVYEK